MRDDIIEMQAILERNGLGVVLVKQEQPPR